MDNVVGLFINTLALRLRSQENLNVDQYIRYVHEKLVSGLQHRDIPFEQLVSKLKLPRNINHQAIFQVMFNYIEEDTGQLTGMSGVTVSPVAMPHYVAKFDLTLSAQHHAEDISLNLEYKSAVFSEKTAQQFLFHYTHVLKQFLQYSDQSLDSVSLLSEDERYKISTLWNNTYKEYPLDTTLIELFEKTAEQYPEHIALELHDAQLSYLELNTRSNLLARELVKNHVSHESIGVI